MTKRHFWLFSHPHSAWMAGWRTIRGRKRVCTEGPSRPAPRARGRMLLTHQCYACMNRTRQSVVGVGMGARANLRSPALFVSRPQAADAK